MLELIEKLEKKTKSEAKLVLPFESRKKTRLKANLDDGTEVGLFLPRGDILRNGDLLKGANGMIVEVVAAAEKVSTAFATNELQHARASYHLGNRHIPVQIDSTWLRYLEDHVLDTMLVGLGLQIQHELAPFEPESGAYSHQHSHRHEH
jgi:urease accessory protein